MPFLIGWLLLQITFFSSGASAASFSAFGPQTFKATGTPQIFNLSFSVLNPNTQYTLHIQNSGVTSAAVSLNGKSIITPKDFGSSVTVIDRLVTLLAQNQISVAITGKAGTSFQLSVIGVDNDAPVIVASASPAANAANWNNTNVLVTFKCSDATSGIAICPSPVSVTTEGAAQIISGTAVDKAGNKSTASITLNIDKTQPTVAANPVPTANSANWNNTNVTVGFLCADALSGVASCTGPVTFANEGANQTATGTAVDKAGNSASTSATINIDKTPPTITVTSPANNSTVSTPMLQVTGSVTDALSGVAAIYCNSIAALVQSGSFTCSTTLATGLNNVNVTATDVAGNTTTTSLSVTLSNAQPVIADFSPKSGPVGTLVTLTGNNLTSTGNPTQIALNQQGGGSINAPISSATGTTLAFVIPAGAATGPITVTSSGQSATSAVNLQVTAASSFTISAGPGTATLLQGKTAAYSVSLDSADGFSQLAKLSVSGVPAGVTASFAPSQITAGQTSILTVSAPATQPTGSSTLTISAAATVDGIPSTQTANVSLSVQPVTTSFFGRVVESDTIESPLPGIVITFLGVDDAAHTTGCSGRTVADAAGNFIFTNLPDACTGRQLVQYNGLTASDGEAYAGVNLAYTIIKGQATGPELVHLPRIDNAETVMVKQNDTIDQTFGFKTMPGITVTVYAGTVFTMPDGTQPDPFPFTGVEVPVDRLPDAPVDGPGTLRAFIVAFQPADTNSNQPVAVSFPNFINTPPGVNMELDTLDPVVGDLVKYGTGTVSGDGTQVVPDLDPAHPGHRFGIQHFDWHGPMAPAPNGINPGPDPNGPTSGDPVDPASGLFVMTKTDISFGGARGIVALMRTYRTLAGTPGPFGVGTSHNYSYQLNTFSFIQGQSFVTLIMPDGNQFQFIQQSGGTFVNTTIPALRGAVLTATPPNFVLRYKDGSTLTFQNPPTGGRVAYLVSMKDRNGNLTTMTRGNQNSPIQITQIIDPVGRQLNITYDNFDRITSVTDPIGRVVSYTYNAQGTLDTFVDAAGGTTRYAYDARNRIASITDPRGIVYLQNIYDSNGKVVKQIAADGGVTQFAYTLLNANASVILGADATTVNTSPVLLTVTTDPQGNQTTYHYNAQGFLIDMTDALGQKTIYERDPGTNLLLSVTDPLNRTTAYTYDAAGNPLTSTALAGTAAAQTTSFTYDPIFNKTTSITNPMGQSTTMDYDAAGNLISTTDPAGHSSTMQYDSTGELLATKDPLGNTTSFVYANGNVASIKDPLGNITLQNVDAAGRLVSSTTALGQTTTYNYSPLNQVTSIVNPTGGRVLLQRDANGNLLSVTDPLLHTTTYTYDAMDRIATRTDPLSRQQTYSYDLNGNLIAVTDRRGKMTEYEYDPLNRRTSVGFGTAGTTVESSIKYVYDGGNRVVQAIDSNAGSITEKYDGLNRLVQEDTPFGSVKYGYDAAGHRTNVTTIGDLPVLYEYDSAGLLRSVTKGTTSISFLYDEANRRTSLTLSNGIVANYSYDQASRITSIVYTHGTSLIGDLNYDYDALGRRVRQSGTLARIAMPSAIGSAHYDSSNQLLDWNGTAITYDQNGNVTSDGTNQFVWNARNELAQLNGSSLQYDAFGRRTRDLSGFTFLYSGPNPVAIFSGGSPISRRLTSGTVDEVFLNSDAAGEFTPITDVLGSVLGLTDSNGNIITSYLYDPYGNTTISGANNPDNLFQFTGRENDSVGIYYLRHRYYSSVMGRFLSEDPMGMQTGINFYSYADDSPVNLIDPFGLDAVAAPGFWESLIPVWGSGRQAVHDFECGNWFGGLLNTGLAISDVFLLKSLATAAGKVGIEGLAKLSGSNTWSATSKWLTKTGWREFPGQQFHHWLIPQSGWGELVPDIIKNQPWNLMGMPEGLAGDVFHDAIEGKGSEAMGLLGRLWNGSPTWAKVFGADAAGKAGNLAGRNCGCN
jgi:RHS repeat-associated protein